MDDKVGWPTEMTTQQKMELSMRAFATIQGLDGENMPYDTLRHYCGLCLPQDQCWECHSANECDEATCEFCIRKAVWCSDHERYEFPEEHCHNLGKCNPETCCICIDGVEQD